MSGRCDYCGALSSRLSCEDCEADPKEKVSAVKHCGCHETYPQLVPGRVSHAPDCPTRTHGLLTDAEVALLSIRDWYCGQPRVIPQIERAFEVYQKRGRI